jgi:hypothetical protein
MPYTILYIVCQGKKHTICGFFIPAYLKGFWKELQEAEE